MSETEPFEEARAAPPDSRFLVDLEGYEGPLDVLLDLARDQKVDLTRLSILALADQYLEFIRAARHLRLELAADYLVMAAWLAYLKSRLLLPDLESEEGEPSGAEMAAALRFQMQRLQAMRDAGSKILALPQLGSEVFRRGAPEPLRVVTKTRYSASLYDLLRAYSRSRGPTRAKALRIAPQELYTVDAAIERLGRLLGETPGWRTLASFLPPDIRGGIYWRSTVAATFAAALEMCRRGQLRLRQDTPFGQIQVHQAKEKPVEVQ
ncbi:MAG: segregation and condensation protein A [Kiloniellales bacterium]